MTKIPIQVLMDVFNLSLTDSYHFNNPTEEQIEIIKLVEWGLKNRIPISRIVNKRFFWKDEFTISPFVLDPRRETEELVNYAMSHLKPNSTLDLGTGTGCLLLSLLREFPSAYGLGVDISKYAIENAKVNSMKLGIQADFVALDLSQVIGTFDLIISNPPYVNMDCEFEALFDPPISLHESGCYSKIIQKKNLNSGGSILLEVPLYSSITVEELAIENQLRIDKRHISENILLYCLSCTRHSI